MTTAVETALVDALAELHFLTGCDPHCEAVRHVVPPCGSCGEYHAGPCPDEYIELAVGDVVYRGSRRGADEVLGRYLDATDRLLHLGRA